MVKLLMFVTLLAAVAITFAHGPMNDEQKSKIMEFKQQCADELKISPEDMNKMKSGEQMVNSNPSFKCFSKCVLDKSGVMVDGKINESAAFEKLEGYIGHDQAANIINECKEVGGADPCEIASKYMECIHKNKH